MHIYDNNKNSLAFWFPIIKDLGLPVPDTHIIHTTGRELIKMMDDVPVKQIKGLQKLVDDIDHYAREVGYPCFLRTGHTSNKHDWKDSCFLQSKKEILGHVASLVEMSAMADFSLDFFVVRKMIKTKPYFTAFNKMPITKEVRCFIEKDSITVRRYWPKEAFPRLEAEKDLDKMYELSEKDIAFFNKILPFLKKQLPSEWCVDFLQNIKGEWILIDMSIASVSYRNDEDNGILIDYKDAS